MASRQLAPVALYQLTPSAYQEPQELYHLLATHHLLEPHHPLESFQLLELEPWTCLMMLQARCGSSTRIHTS